MRKAEGRLGDLRAFLDSLDDRRDLALLSEMNGRECADAQARGMRDAVAPAPRCLRPKPPKPPKPDVEAFGEGSPRRPAPERKGTVARMTRKELGELIHRARELAEWSTDRLAEGLGVPRQSVERAERGDRRWPAGSQARSVGLLLDAFADKHHTERIPPRRLTSLGAARLLAVAVALSHRLRRGEGQEARGQEI